MPAGSAIFRRGFRTLRGEHRKPPQRRRRPSPALNQVEEPFDYFGLSRTPSDAPPESDDEGLVEYLFHAFIDGRTDAARFPRPESHLFYILDTAAYNQLQSTLNPDSDPLCNWAIPRLQQQRLYTTAEDAALDDGWLRWGCADRPSRRAVFGELCPFIGFEKIPSALATAFADLIQAYTRDPSQEFERQGIFVTGYDNLTREFFRRPVMWLKFTQFMRECTAGERAGAFELRDVRQVYDCGGSPEELPFDDLFPKELWREIETFSPRMGFSVDRLPIELPDWYDEFPLDAGFWDLLPDAELRPWDRKHVWFKLRPPEPGRVVYYCDLAAYRILSEEAEKVEQSVLGRWTKERLREGKLYVRDWERPGLRGLPRRNEQLDLRDRRGWKLLPWPVYNMEYAVECPALSSAAWPVVDYCFIVDRYLKEHVFVTGDPEIAAEVGSPGLRNWLLRSRRIHVVHDVRQVYGCGNHREPVPVNLDS